MMINDNGTLREATAAEVAVITEMTTPDAVTTPEDRLELLESAVQELALMIGGEV